ncbi:acyltransferase [Paenibacillus sp. JDR-2]|uniref:acyltransferase n=1 Tax=Paenibacillus sp. (strain JDR-2) TaxID=324057 RepID=UPI000166B49C|nr:acyltransferase [Paenibacillus sp. JDR-2]ACT02476.1 putative acetyltransferase protein [Paenibacillus sp. JDR-2]
MHLISDSAAISPLCDLETSVRGSKLIIGDHSKIDAFVKIKFAGGSGDIQLGQQVQINSGTVIYSGNGVRVDDNVLVAANCTFASVNHAYLDRNRLIREQGFLPSKGGIIIEEDVWIGANCVILDGTHIGKGAVVGANSLVRGKLEAYGVYAGNPLRLKGVRS